MSPNNLTPQADPSASLPPNKPGVQFKKRTTPTQAPTSQPMTPISYQFMPPRAPLTSNPMPPPRIPPTVQKPLPSVVKTSQPDTFLELIRGPTLTLLIGRPPSQQTYTLPSALLGAHSFFFKNEVARVLVQCMSKKRKLRFSDDENEDENVSDVRPGGGEAAFQKADGESENENSNGVKKVDNDNTVEKANTSAPSIKTEANNVDGAYTAWDAEFTSSAILKLPEIDPAIFGLFLKFIYQGSYPAGMDAGRVPYAQTAGLVGGPQRTGAGATSSSTVSMGGGVGGGASRYSPYTPASASSPSAMGMPTMAAAHTGNTPASGRASMPLPRTTTMPQTTPPSISAYLLATRLHAPSFTNHTLTHIYAGIGVYFVLTPSLIDHVWSQTKCHTTKPSLNYSSTSLPSNGHGTSNNNPTFASTSGPTGSRSPLRQLLLDILTLHWSSMSSGHIIAKSATLNSEWNRVFDAHDELRRDFIVGLQGGERRVGAVQDYFVGFGGGSAGGGGNGQVVVKKEGI